jgi:hypothetical protein
LAEAVADLHERKLAESFVDDEALEEGVAPGLLGFLRHGVTVAHGLSSLDQRFVATIGRLCRQLAAFLQLGAGGVEQGLDVVADLHACLEGLAVQGRHGSHAVLDAGLTHQMGVAVAHGQSAELGHVVAQRQADVDRVTPLRQDRRVGLLREPTTGLLLELGLQGAMPSIAGAQGLQGGVDELGDGQVGLEGRHQQFTVDLRDRPAGRLEIDALRVIAQHVELGARLLGVEHCAQDERAHDGGGPHHLVSFGGFRPLSWGNVSARLTQ